MYISPLGGVISKVLSGKYLATRCLLSIIPCRCCLHVFLVADVIMLFVPVLEMWCLEIKTCSTDFLSLNI